MSIREVATLIAIAVIVIYTVIDKYKEWTARKKGLAANPERCEQHATRLTKIEKDIEYIREDIREIKEHG